MEAIRIIEYCHLTRRLLRCFLSSGVNRPSVISLFIHRFAIDDRRNLSAFSRLQFVNHFLHGILVKIRQEQTHIVQRIVNENMTLKWSTNHTSEQLRNICRILCTTERHHGFCTRAIPTGRQILFEENHTDAAVFRNLRRLNMRHIQSVDHQRACRAKGMYNLVFLEAVAHALFDFGNYIVQIGVRYSRTGAGTDLDNKNRIYICVVLLIGILIPVLALILPLICCRLEHSHVAVLGRVFRISDDNTIFKKSGLANLSR